MYAYALLALPLTTGPDDPVMPVAREAVGQAGLGCGRSGGIGGADAKEPGEELKKQPAGADAFRVALLMGRRTSPPAAKQRPTGVSGPFNKENGRAARCAAALVPILSNRGLANQYSCHASVERKAPATRRRLWVGSVLRSRVQAVLGSPNVLNDSYSDVVL